jgi:DNA-directed RNA polymerase subunit RPC12/RpoP
MITIQSKGKTRSLGWCSVLPIWFKNSKSDNDTAEGIENESNNIEPTMYEINLSAEHINRPFKEIVSTLLHEMCHLSNSLKGIQDCTKSQYHNEQFKTEAEHVGLKVEKVKKFGYAITECGEELSKEIDEWSFCDKTIFNIARIENTKEKIVKQSTTVKYICPKCNSKVKGIEGLNIMCEDCDEKFVEAEKN